ncbi:MULTISPECIES: rhodanese-like domain-containing protein [Hymenobacter]|uniref:Rhodanese-like domain-containing protein n=2 Tax=Hymenobacter TaxID=89966 RepID=A0ABS6X555_9BACT|nr:MULTISPECIES: rhodanese-like domain-containing protein [Hymenobacter]MBO3269561.1 rhodanese-like domain-containing protein [Hymenobacter defluvii]MBW3130968.1 rhodanese-like domain-containing protein [Hymenobacter profundi]
MSRFLLLAFAGALTFTQLSCSSNTSVTPTETAALLQKPDVVVLDVRTPEEYADGHLAGARNIDFKAPDFDDRIAQLDKSKTYVLYCASGNRSGKTATLMAEKGFAKVDNAGGFKDLKAAGLPTE